MMTSRELTNPGGAVAYPVIIALLSITLPQHTFAAEAPASSLEHAAKTRAKNSPQPGRTVSGATAGVDLQRADEKLLYKQWQSSAGSAAAEQSLSRLRQLRAFVSADEKLRGLERDMVYDERKDSRPVADLVKEYCDLVSNGPFSDEQKLRRFMWVGEKSIGRDHYKIVELPLSRAQEILNRAKDGGDSSRYKRSLLNLSAWLHELHGELDAAEQDLEQAAALPSAEGEHAGYTTDWLSGSLAMRRGEYKRAEEILSKIRWNKTLINHALDSSYVSSRLDLAYAYYAQKKFQVAKLTLIRVLEVEPHSPFSRFAVSTEANTLLALCYCQTGHKSFAETTLEQSLEPPGGKPLSPSSTRVRAYLNRGKLEELLGNKTEANKFFQTAKELLSKLEYQDPALSREIEERILATS